MNVSDPIRPLFRRSKVLLAASIASIMLPMVSWSATIERHVDPVMGCAVLVSDVITDGAAEELKRLLKTIDPWTDEGLPQRWSSGNHGFRICFDSPGGSLPEGIRMARVIQELQFGTAISEGARCESACALAFMAGMQMSEADYEGVRSNVDRVLHPQGVLGFHAPDLSIAEGAYNERVVLHAYAVALQSVSAILDLIEETRIELPQTLLREMLATPPDQMFRVERVEQALDWGIVVAPTRFSDLPLIVAFETACGQWGGWPREPRYFDAQASVTFVDERSNLHSPRLSARVEVSEGFGMEASEPCVVEFSLSGAPNDYLSDQMISSSLNVFRNPWHGNYAFSTYHSTTKLSTLPSPDFASDIAFIEQFRKLQGRHSDFTSCWLTSANARVTNVNEYVNLRRQPDFSARVIRQVPLSEQVRPLRFDNLSVIGQERDRQSCINACQAFGANSDDRTARDRVQQCVEDNMLWYEITDARGNRGWVSRKFLKEAE